MAKRLYMPFHRGKAHIFIKPLSHHLHRTLRQRAEEGIPVVLRKHARVEDDYDALVQPRADEAADAVAGSRELFRPGFVEQASWEIPQSMDDADDVQSIVANTVEDEMPAEWLSHEEEANFSELCVCVVGFLSD